MIRLKSISININPIKNRALDKSNALFLIGSYSVPDIECTFLFNNISQGKSPTYISERITIESCYLPQRITTIV